MHRYLVKYFQDILLITMVQFSNCFFLAKAVRKKFFTYCVTVKYQFKSVNSLGCLHKCMNKAIKCSFQCKILLKEVKACLNSWLVFSSVYILRTRALPSPHPRLPHPLNDNFKFFFFLYKIYIIEYFEQLYRNEAYKIF